MPPPIRFARAWTRDGYDRTLEDLGWSILSPAGGVWNAPKASSLSVVVDRFPLSKSSIEMFLSCPRQFFYRKLLRIPQVQVGSAQLGTLFHDVMARLGKQFKTKAKLHTGATPAVIGRLIDEVIREETNVEPSSFFDRSLRHYLERMVRGILDVDAGLDESYTIADVEEGVPFTFKGWSFSGRVDRIEDQTIGGKRIVDFKTGEIRKTGNTHRKYVLKALEDPRKADWQIPFYICAMAVRDGRYPDAFRYMAAKAGEDPLAITLFVYPNEAGDPAAAHKAKYESYLCENEIEEIMGLAVVIAEDIFTPKHHFARSDDDNPCAVCEFSELCQREKKWS